MSDQNHPLPKDFIEPNQSAVEPAFWIEKLYILPSLSATDKPIREVPFQRGLNIIWSKPANVESKSSEKGRGHAAGKTSLSRAIRYLLGDKDYGSEFIKKKLQQHSKLSLAYLAANIWINGKCWAIIRPIGSHKSSSAYRNTTVNEVIQDTPKSDTGWNEYLQELKSATVDRLDVQSFDADGNRNIQWRHLLEPLTRDQESHLAALHQWRNSQVSDSMQTSAADRAFILRGLLGLSDPEETSFLTERAASLKNIQSSERSRTTYRQVLQDEADKLSIDVKDIPQTSGEADEQFMWGVKNEADKHINKSRNELIKKIEDLNIPVVTEKRDSLNNQINRIELRLEEPTQKLEDDNTKLKSYLAKPNKTKEDELDLEAYIHANIAHGGKACNVPIGPEMHECPVYKKHNQQLKIFTEDAPTPMEQELATSEAQLRWNIKNLQDKIKPDQALMTDLKTKLSAEQVTLKNAIKSKGELEAEIRDLPLVKSNSELSAQKMIEALIQIEVAQLEITNTKKKLEEIDESLASIRSNSKGRQKELSSIFNQVIKYLIHDDLTGELKFTNVENNAILRRNGELDSAAYRALKCIAYDLTALTASLKSSTPKHPRFLLHDSPRESDLDKVIYHMIFHFIFQLNKLVPNSFQYIITTTEHPPEEFQKAPYLQTELSSSKKEQKFYREDL